MGINRLKFEHRSCNKATTASLSSVGTTCKLASAKTREQNSILFLFLPCSSTCFLFLRPNKTSWIKNLTAKNETEKNIQGFYLIIKT